MPAVSQILRTPAGQSRLLALILCVVALALSARAYDQTSFRFRQLQMAIAAAVIGIVFAGLSLFFLANDYHSRWGTRYSKSDAVLIMLATILLAMGAGALFFGGDIVGGIWDRSCDTSWLHVVNASSFCALWKAASVFEILASLVFGFCVLLHFDLADGFA